MGFSHSANECLKAIKAAMNSAAAVIIECKYTQTQQQRQQQAAAEERNGRRGMKKTIERSNREMLFRHYH
jgi:enoyl-CoA hydratase/carnithine racemase